MNFSGFFGSRPASGKAKGIAAAGIAATGISKRYGARDRRFTALERSSHPLIGLIGLFFFLVGQVAFPLLAQAQVAKGAAKPKAPAKPAPDWAKARDRKEATGSKPGRIQPSEDTGCEDCEVTMQALDLSRVPTEKELRMAGQLGGALNPIGNADVAMLAEALDEELIVNGVDPQAAAKANPNSAAGKLHKLKIEKIERLKQINLTFGAAIQEWNQHHFTKAAKMFEQHVEAYPDSPWAGEALLHLGCDAKYNGRFSEAQSRYAAILDTTQNENRAEVRQKKALKKQAEAEGNARAAVAIVDSAEIHWKAKARWADLDMSLGRLDDSLAKLRDIAQNDPDWKRRTWAQAWQVTTGIYKANARDLRACGSQALSTVLAQLDKKEAALKVAQLHPKTEAGYSLAEMQTIAARNGVPMRGFKATSAVALENLPTPFIVHYDFSGIHRQDTKSAKNGQEKKESWLSGSSLRGFDAGVGGQRPMVKKQRLAAGDQKPAAKTKAQGSKIKGQSPYRIKVESPDHFLVVEKVDGAGREVKVYDPLEKRFYRLSFAQLEREWSGKGLMLAESARSAQAGRTPRTAPRIAWLSPAEMQRTRGGCCGSYKANPGPGKKKTTKTVKGPCPPTGEPGIAVDEANLNVLIQDIPLWYTPEVGPSVELMVSYNSQDALTQASPVGNKWTLNYRSYAIEDTQAGGGVVIVFMPDGAKKSYYPDGSGGYRADAGNFNRLTKPTATRYELELQGGGKMIFDRPAGTTSLQSLLIEVRDARGYSLQMHYEDQGNSTNLTNITDAQGKVTTLAYDESSHLLRVTDPFERQASFSYDANGNLVECVDMEGHAFQYTYDSEINVTRLNTAQGPWNIAYDNEYPHYFVQVTDPTGQPQKFAYESWGAHTYSFTSPGGASTGYECYAIVGGDPQITTTRSVSGVLNFNYDMATGETSQITDARGNVTNFSYNAQGMLTGTTDPLGHTTTIGYAANGLDVTSVTNADNVAVFTASYNAYHQPTSVTDAQGHTSTTTYTAWGAPATVTNAANQITTYNYDATTKQLTSVSRGGSTLASFSYDEVGRVKTATDALNFTVGYQYNNLDKVTKVTYPDGTFSSVEYVCCGMPGVVTDRAGRKSYYDYDSLKRLTRMQDAAGQSVQLDYDAMGNLARLIDAKGNVTRWQYDSDQRLVRKLYHDGSDEKYTYTLDLLSATTNPRGQVTGYSYDNDSRLTGINYPNMADVALSYDALDRMTSMTDGLGTSSYSYDTLDRVTSIDGPWANDTVNYSYDALGRQSALGLNGSTLSSYGYDAMDRLSTLSSGAGTWNYSYVGNTGILAQITNPNGTKSVYGYDAMQRLTSVANVTSSNANLSSFAYGFDAAGQPQRDVRTLVDKTYGANPTQRVSYTYDTVDQLTNEVLSENNTALVSKSFAYDAMGNRSAGQTVSATDTVSSTYSANKLNQITAASSSWGGGANTSASSFAYDQSGNLTNWNTTGTGSASSSHIEYVYDDADRLTNVIKKDPATGANESKTEFVYDGMSRLRVSREYSWDNGAWVLTPNSEKRRIYDGMDVIQERDSTNVSAATYTRDGNIGGILAKSSSDGNFYFHYDGSGNVVGLSEVNQNSVAEYAYDAYGNLLSSNGAQAVGNAYRYSTKEYFGIGLYNYGYRFYSPGMGRWINRDPIEEWGGGNLYQFVGNSPVNKVDLRGLVDLDGDGDEDDPMGYDDEDMDGMPDRLEGQGAGGGSGGGGGGGGFITWCKSLFGGGGSVGKGGVPAAPPPALPPPLPKQVFTAPGVQPPAGRTFINVPGENGAPPETFVIPPGGTLTPSNTRGGLVITYPNGNSIRIMPPAGPPSYPYSYPNGYVTFEKGQVQGGSQPINMGGQTVKPKTSDYHNHRPISGLPPGF